MPFWTLPPIPGMTKFLWGFAAMTLLIGLVGYVFERRKEVQKERRRRAAD